MEKLTNWEVFSETPPCDVLAAIVGFKEAVEHGPASRAAATAA